MIHLDFHDPRPMYEQVVEQFEMLIARGALAADERIPSVRQLSVQLSLNPNTVQKAYSELLSRGEIYSCAEKEILCPVTRLASGTRSWSKFEGRCWRFSDRRRSSARAQSSCMRC